MQHLSEFFVTSANAALSKSDEPEQVCTCLPHLNVNIAVSSRMPLCLLP